MLYESWGINSPKGAFKHQFVSRHVVPILVASDYVGRHVGPTLFRLSIKQQPQLKTMLVYNPYYGICTQSYNHNTNLQWFQLCRSNFDLQSHFLLGIFIFPESGTLFYFLNNVVVV